VYPTTRLGSLALATWLALASSSPAAGPGERAPRRWERVNGIADVRYDGASDLSAALRSGPVTLPLPWPILVDRQRFEAMRVEVGSATLLPRMPVPTSPAAAPRALGDTGTRIDLLAGPDIRLGDGPVLALLRGDVVAVRFAQLVGPSGDAAIAELVARRDGSLTLQYLHVPERLAAAAREGSVRATSTTTAGGAGLEPRSATAFRLQEPLVRLQPLPGVPPRPLTMDPPPPTCTAPPGDWCRAADGPGSVIFYLSENFDDGMSAARGWGGPGLWHETPFGPACAPAASTNPGRAWYHGQDATCRYLDSSGATLLAPAVGPITLDTQLTFTFRLLKEDGFDFAEVLINGMPIGGLNSPPDPFAWYQLDPVDLSAFDGQVITLGFRFTADASNNTLGWFVDDVLLWDANGANDRCVINAGRLGYEPCSTTVSDAWDFNEVDRCVGCTYTFYVLAECGREMHLAFRDAEGADVQVTELATGAPVALRCVNQTSRADAGMGAYSGLAGDCCAPPGNEVWWGPPLDVTDAQGPGRVAWGAGGCVAFEDLDLDMDGLECAELLPPCGGQDDRVSPGDRQVMDCFVRDVAGACGVYRVDITAGSDDWSLYSNCDGTATPRHRIFHSCTDAWTAWTPSPELGVTNLVVSDTCPGLLVGFDVVNLACTEHPGPTTVRITSNCVPPETLDHVVTDPIPAGGSVSVTDLPFGVACQPVRVDVVVDPDDAVLECSESALLASCDQAAGVNALSGFTCGCTAMLLADPGPDAASCAGEMVRLDGSASLIAPCAQPLYRWLDATGTELGPASPDPVAFAPLTQCPGGTSYTLEVSCQGEPCVDTEVIQISCLEPVADAGADVRYCTDTSFSIDASASSVPGCARVLYRFRDPAGTVVRDWMPDPVYSVTNPTCDQAGFHSVDVSCETGGPCLDTDTVLVECVEVLADAGPDVQVCEGVASVIDQAGAISQGCVRILFQWYDTMGTPLTPVLTDPTVGLPPLTNCPGTLTLVLVAACGDAGFETCGTFDAMDVDCLAPADPVPTATVTCGGPSADLRCGVAEPGMTYSWDTDTAADSDMDGDAANDADLAGCDVAATWPTPGTRTVRAWATEPVLGCRSSADIDVTPLADPLPPVPTATPACAGRASALACGVSEAGATYAWDADIAVDGPDPDAVPDNDVDAVGCDVQVTYATAGLRTSRVTATDGRGCTTTADVAVDVPPAPVPGEVVRVRLARTGAAVTLTWAAESDAVTYRVARGDLTTLRDLRTYDHAADEPAGRGSCDTLGMLAFTDPDDASGAADHYYVVTAVSSCGIEGAPGDAFDGRTRTPRAARASTASCP
jgi:hypothetical protein